MPYATESGVDAGLLSLDIYPVGGADCGSSPVIVYVHGGGWRRGDKASAIALEHKLTLAKTHGWVFVSVNYRLSDSEAADPVRYPDHPTDVGRAVAYVHDNISAYGGDPEAVVLMGHSAGAGIVSQLGAEPGFITDAGATPPTCVVSLDTEAYDITRTIESSGKSTVEVYENAFGTDPEVWIDASPIKQLDDNDPFPAFLIVTRGTDLRVRMAEDFAAAIEDSGGSSQLLVVPGYSHAEVNLELGVAGETELTPAVVEFIDACVA